MGWLGAIPYSEADTPAVKTNLVFFDRPLAGEPATQAVWYYDLSDTKVGKKTPFTLDHIQDFFRPLPEHGASERSWTVPVAALRERNYDLKAVNANAKAEKAHGHRKNCWTSAKGQEVMEAVVVLRAATGEGPVF